MSETKRCPFCAEDIAKEAIKCKHCGEFLNNKDDQINSSIPDEKYKNYQNFSDESLSRIIDLKNNYDSEMVQAAKKVLNERQNSSNNSSTHKPKFRKINHTERKRKEKIKNRNKNIIGVIAIIFGIIFLGFFHILPGHFTIFPKAHFTYSYTFVSVDDVIKKYNNRNIGERLRGDELFDHLIGKLKDKGLIYNTGERKSIDLDF